MHMSTSNRGDSRQLLHKSFAPCKHSIKMANTDGYTSKYFSRPATDIDKLLNSASITAFQRVRTIDFHFLFVLALTQSQACIYTPALYTRRHRNFVRGTRKAALNLPACHRWSSEKESARSTSTLPPCHCRQWLCWRLSGRLARCGKRCQPDKKARFVEGRGCLVHTGRIFDCQGRHMVRWALEPMINPAIYIDLIRDLLNALCVVHRQRCVVLVKVKPSRERLRRELAVTQTCEFWM